MKKLFVIAGEASGDLHASNLLKALQPRIPNLEVQGFGGEELEQAGMKVLKHYREMDFMGFVEVILNLRTISRNLNDCKQAIKDFQPDAILLIDYPGFNLRIADFAHQLGIKVVYYISPQIWAWKENRVHKIKRVVDKMLVILPFEKQFYAKHNVTVDFVGHPLIDAIQQKLPTLPERSDLASEYALSDKPIIAVLPGSRKQEIGVKLPIMLKALQAFEKDYQIVVAGAPSQTAEFYQPFLQGSSAKMIKGKTYALLKNAHAAVVTSGTATLETALFKVPQVVCYKGSSVSYHIAKRLIKVKYISLVNLIMDKPVVKELIQADCTPKNIQEELQKVLAGKEREKVLTDYNALETILGEGGASENAAKELESILI